MDYKSYLQGSHWRQLRQRFFSSKRFNGRCFICSNKEKIFEIHHKTYKQLGAEKLNNLVALCSTCHYAVHHDDQGNKLPMNGAILNDRVYRLKRLCQKALTRS